MNRDVAAKRKACQNLAVITILLSTLGLGICTMAYGEIRDIELVVHGLSVHFNPYRSDSQNWNGRNPGFGIRIPLDKKNSFALQEGTYNNSFARTSHYLGVDWLPIHRGFIGIGAGLGAATGYTVFNGEPIPIGGPVVQLKTSDRLSMRFRVFPPVVPRSTGAVSLELSWRLYKRNPAKH